jgi:hypothetical protein
MTKIVDLLVQANGLCHWKVLAELKIVASLGFDGRGSCLDTGMYLKHYWNSWSFAFPVLADCLEQHFDDNIAQSFSA